MRAGNIILSMFCVALFGVCSASFAEDAPASSAARDAAYYLYSAQTFDAHAKDHARILNRLTAAGGQVPQKVVAEQTAAIRSNVESAAKDFATLKKLLKDNADLAKKVAELEARLGQIEKSRTKVNESCEEMLDAAVAAGKTNPGALPKCCATMTNELQTFSKAINFVLDRFQQQDEVRRELERMRERSE